MSQIEIRVVAVENSTVPTAKGSYGVAEVTYKNLTFEGKVETKKVMSFVHKSVFDTLKTAKAGDIHTIQRVKNDKGYWDWVSVDGTNAAEGEEEMPKTTAAAAGKSYASPKSTYETPEERAKKQIYIVRQSSISNAIEYNKTAKPKATTDDILHTAAVFEDYVFGQAVDDKPAQVDLSDEDIPY